MRRITAVITVFAAAGVFAPAGAGDAPVGASIGYDQPESAAWDAESDAWYVSSKGPGTPGAGFISKVDAAGVVMAERWFEGIDSPFGLDVHDGKLYASDLTNVRIIDIATATLDATIPVAGATGLNDIEVDGATGDIYASGGAIYKIPAGGTEGALWLSSSALGSPNGLLAEDGTLLVATLTGPGGLGQVMRVDLEDQTIAPLSEPIGVLDGIVRHGDDYIVSDFITGRIMRVTQDGTTTLQYPLPPSAADLGIDPVSGAIGVPITFPNLMLVLPA